MPSAHRPSATAVSVDLPSDGSFVQVGSLPIKVAKPTSASSLASVTVKVLGDTSAQALGANELAFVVLRHDNRAGDAPVRVQLDFSQWRYLYGANSADRTALYQVPLCTNPAASCPADSAVTATKDLANFTLTTSAAEALPTTSSTLTPDPTATGSPATSPPAPGSGPTPSTSGVPPTTEAPSLAPSSPTSSAADPVATEVAPTSSGAPTSASPAATPTQPGETAGWTSTSMDPPPTPSWIPQPKTPSPASSSGNACQATPELTALCNQLKTAGVGSTSTSSATAYAASTGPAGSGGNFQTTSVAATGDWAAGTQSGDFGYTYPLTLPPAAIGDTPDVTLNYSSQSVDGRTASRNNQASVFGLGWEYTPGSVNAAFMPCSQSGTTKTYLAQTGDGDLCKSTSTDGRGAIYSIDLGNRTSKLYLQTSGTTSYWRLEDDPGSRVTFFNSDEQNSWWLLETSDGTKYYYGSNDVIPNPHYNDIPATTRPYTQSRWTVPVFDGTGTGCHAVASKYCNLPWKWNLDHVTERSGAQTWYGYTPENNNYNSLGAGPAIGTGATLAYTRGGYLNALWYGARSQSPGAYPAERVLFNVLGRCAEMTQGGTSCPSMDSSHTASFPDVPVDQICTAATCTTNKAPAFFTGARIDSIETQRLDTSAYNPVDRYEFNFSFPPQQNDSTTSNYSAPGAQTPSLFLSSVARRGADTDSGGASILLPPTSFTYTTDRWNRVDYDMARGVLPMYMPRVASVTTALGSLITPTYSNSVGGGQCTPQNVTSITQGSNNMMCFPLYFSPGGSVPAGWGWYYKNIVTRVDQTSSTSDASFPTLDDVTTYSYSYADGNYGSSSGVLWGFDHDPTVKGDKHSFSRFVGFPHVETVHGATGGQRDITDDWYYTGLSGEPTASDGTGSRANTIHSHLGATDERYNDSYQLAGDLIRESRMDESGNEITSVQHNKRWVATAGTAGFDEEASTVTATAQSGYPFRYRRIENTYNDTGTQTGTLASTLDLSSVNSAGTTLDAAHETCTVDEYAPNIVTSGDPTTALWMTSFVGRQRTWNGDCSAVGTYTAWTQFKYDDVNALWNTPPTYGKVVETDKKVDGTNYSRSGMTYDSMKRPVTTWDSKNADGSNPQTTTISYEAPPCDTARCMNPLWIQTTSPGPLTTRTTMLRGRGLPTDVQDANGQHTLTSYDTLGRVISTTLPVQFGHACPTLASYTVSSTTPSRVRVQTPTANDGTTCTYRDDYTFIDSRGRTIEQQAPSSAIDTAGGMNPVVTQYNDRGAVERVSAPFLNTQTFGTFYAFDNAIVPTAHRTLYDNLDRPIQQDLVHNGARQWVTTTSYDGYKATVTPPSGHPGNATTPSYDPITTSTDAFGRTLDIRYASQSHSTTYSYDAAGTLNTVTDPAGNATHYTYDLLGRQLTSDSSDAGHVNSVYDYASNLASVTHTGGTSGGVTYPSRTLSYVYDSSNRRIKTFDGLRPPGVSGDSVS